MFFCLFHLFHPRPALFYGDLTPSRGTSTGANVQMLVPPASCLVLRHIGNMWNKRNKQSALLKSIQRRAPAPAPAPGGREQSPPLFMSAEKHHGWRLHRVAPWPRPTGRQKQAQTRYKTGTPLRARVVYRKSAAADRARRSRPKSAEVSPKIFRVGVM